MIELYSDQPQYVKLEQRLALLAWLNYQFGYNSNRELLWHVKQADEGYDAEGRSFVSGCYIARETTAHAVG